MPNPECSRICSQACKAYLKRLRKIVQNVSKPTSAKPKRMILDQFHRLLCKKQKRVVSNKNRGNTCTSLLQSPYFEQHTWSLLAHRRKDSCRESPLQNVTQVLWRESNTIFNPIRDQLEWLQSQYCHLFRCCQYLGLNLGLFMTLLILWFRGLGISQSIQKLLHSGVCRWPANHSWSVQWYHSAKILRCTVSRFRVIVARDGVDAINNGTGLQKTLRGLQLDAFQTLPSQSVKLSNPSVTISRDTQGLKLRIAISQQPQRKDLKLKRSSKTEIHIVGFYDETTFWLESLCPRKHGSPHLIASHV